VYFKSLILLAGMPFCFQMNYDQTLTRPVLDQFQDSSKTGSGINFFPPFLPHFFAAFFATFFAAFFANFFGPAFLRTFLSTQYKRRAILSMQYKSLLPFLGVWGGV